MFLQKKTKLVYVGMYSMYYYLFANVFIFCDHPDRYVNRGLALTLLVSLR